MNIGEILSPTAYFGCYPTMGIRRVDAGAAILPIRFAFGVVDYKGVSAPPTAVSFFYMPSLLSTYVADPDGRQAFFLGQVRFKTNVSGIQTTFRFNAGGSKSEYFTYSSINGNRTLSGTADFNIARDYTLYAEYGIQNNTRARETTALCYGAKIERLGTWGPFSIDSALFEMQKPMTEGTTNPFTGGNSISPALGQVPEMSWYGKVRARAKAVFIDFNITNAVGDYTFARLVPEALNSPLSLPLGPGYETEGTRIPFMAKAYDARAYLVTAGVEF